MKINNPSPSGLLQWSNKMKKLIDVVVMLALAVTLAAMFVYGWSN